MTTKQEALEEIEDLKSDVQKLIANRSRLEALHQDEIDRREKAEAELKSYKDLGTALFGILSPYLINVHPSPQGKGIIDFKVGGSFDINVEKIPEPPKNFTTETDAGRVLWILLSKFKGKSTEYKPLREEVNKKWKLSPPEMTFAKEKLVKEMVVFDDGKRLRANFEVGTIKIDGNVLVKEE